MRRGSEFAGPGAPGVVLVAQDTMELDLTRRQEKVGGPLNDESHWGLYAHPQLAMTPERVPLGLVGAKIWSRDEEEFAKSQEVKHRERKAFPHPSRERASQTTHLRDASN